MVLILSHNISWDEAINDFSTGCLSITTFCEVLFISILFFWTSVWLFISISSKSSNKLLVWSNKLNILGLCVNEDNLSSTVGCNPTCAIFGVEIILVSSLLALIASNILSNLGITLFSWISITVSSIGLFWTKLGTALSCLNLIASNNALKFRFRGNFFSRIY